MKSPLSALLLLLSVSFCFHYALPPVSDHGHALGPCHGWGYGETPHASDSGLARYQDLVDQQPVVHKNQGDLDKDGWCLARSQRGQFEVMLPGRYEDYTKKSTTFGGTTEVCFLVETKTEYHYTFNVTRQEHIGKPPSRLLLEAQLPGDREFVQKRNIVFHNHPAIEYRVTFPIEGAIISAEYISFFSGNSHYVLSVFGWLPPSGRMPPAVHRQLRADQAKFFNSFRLLANKDASTAPSQNAEPGVEADSR